MVVFPCNHEVQGPYIIETTSLPPYQTQNPENLQQTVHRTSTPIQDDDLTKKRITGALVCSCMSFWLSGGLFGGIAFILAMKGRSSAKSGNKEKANNYLKASYVLSGAGILVSISVFFGVLFGLGYMSIRNPLFIIPLIIGIAAIIFTVVGGLRDTYFGRKIHYSGR